MALTLRPTVILLDLRMPQEQGSTPSMVRAALLKATDRIVAMSMATDGDASGAANEN
jgi:FixJ family two-component response regulator